MRQQAALSSQSGAPPTRISATRTSRRQSRSERLSWFSEHFLKHLIHQYGHWTIGVIVGLESMGMPLPGETVLLLGALYAGTHHDLNIWAVIGSAAVGAIIGDNVGYFIGRTFGYALLLRFGPYIGATEKRIKLGHYLFMRHGGKGVFFCPFFSLLRLL